MFYLVVAGLLGLVFMISLATALIAESNTDAKTGGIAGAAASVILFVVLTLICSFTAVGARSVAVETAFGKYKGTLQSGPHFTAPWSSVEEFSTQIQSLDLDGKDQNVSVNFLGGGQGKANATVRWNIDTKNAKDLWEKYRTFENVRDQLVSSSAQDSFRVVLGKYSPNEARAGENLRPITDAVRSDLNGTLSRYGVKIDSISVKSVTLDEATQRSLEKIVVANNDTERAIAEQKRAKIDSETAKIRQSSGSLSGAALTRYCLEVTNAWDVAKNGPLPAGWSCVGQNGVVTLSNPPTQ